MTTPRFRGTVLPDGESRDLYVVEGRITLESQAGADTAAEGWIVPGLVDAHCHVGLDEHGAVDAATTEQQALADRDRGAPRPRDCSRGPWVRPPRPRAPEAASPPRGLRWSGRRVARPRRYIRNFAHEIEP